MKIGFYIVFLFFVICSCSSSDYSPKPSGYFRVEFPEKQYQSLSINTPYTFDYPKYAFMYPDSSKDAKKDWYNLSFPQFNARLHISYNSFSNIKQLNELTEDSRKLAFKHTIKATGIDEAVIKNTNKDVYGIYYAIDGNTASSVQFYLTDSAKNYLRGALYFNEKPKQDSIQPILDFIKEDINKMITTFKWKK